MAFNLQTDTHSVIPAEELLAISLHINSEFTPYFRSRMPDGEGYGLFFIKELQEISAGILHSYAPQLLRENALFILPVDPIKLYVHWHMRTAPLLSAGAGEDCEPVLRIYASDMPGIHDYPARQLISEVALPTRHGHLMYELPITLNSVADSSNIPCVDSTLESSTRALTKKNTNISNFYSAELGWRDKQQCFYPVKATQDVIGYRQPIMQTKHLPDAIWDYLQSSGNLACSATVYASEQTN
jgi:hypothetical protein